MYYPYLRGKQFELILLREQAELISSSQIRPIIEPVKNKFNTLARAVGNLVDKNAKFILVVNPQCGDLKNEDEEILGFVDEMIPAGYAGLSLGYIINQDTEIQKVVKAIQEGDRENYSIIHYGYTDGRVLSEALDGVGRINTQVFIEGNSSKLYQKHFRADGVERVLIRNGFKIRKNANYPVSEHFSDLQMTYEDEGVNGFGDFLIVGDEFREGGGPAFAVAIHLTYLNEEWDMFVGHFLSEQQGSPLNTARKFSEALDKLVTAVEAGDSLYLQSAAYDEYKGLNERGHFPGLGYVKKLSMQHHLELMADFLTRK